MSLPRRVLILLAHPAPWNSRFHRRRLAAAHSVAGVTVRDLYEGYPDFMIDVKQEQGLREAHDVILQQHPFYWYSCPAILKERLDLVLEHGFACGTGGRALEGKRQASVPGTGGPAVLGLAGGEGKGVMPFAESGVVVILFWVGLELKPSLLWRLRGPIFGLGGAQVMAAASILSMSSTAIGLQSPAVKGQLKTQGGQATFAVRLFQVLAVTALSMGLTPLVLLRHDRMAVRCKRVKLDGRDSDEIAGKDNPVIIAGYGRVGNIIGRLLISRKVPCTVIGLDAAQVELFRKRGLKVFYGDASREDLLHDAGAGQAKLFVLAIDDVAKSLEIAETGWRHDPGLPIPARAEGRIHNWKVLKRGGTEVWGETLDSGLEMGIVALRRLGHLADEARRAARIFRGFIGKGGRWLKPGVIGKGGGR